MDEIFRIIELSFGLIDVVLISLLMVLNILYLKSKRCSHLPWYIMMLLILCFLLVFPIISMKVEYYLYRLSSGVTPDGFETLYIWLRLPTYWILGCLEWLALALIDRKKLKLLDILKSKY